MEMMMRPGGFFVLFQVMRYLPYIAIGLLVIAVGIWVIFGIKKYRWAKIVAIILTVIIIFTGLFSLVPFAFRGMRGGFFPRDQQQFRKWDEEESKDARLNIYNPGAYYIL